MLMLTFFLIIPCMKIFKSNDNRQLTYQMKQTLALNVILYENNRELLLDDSYNLEIINDELCIIWTDLNHDERKICEKIRL